jgi:SulP family sulfate permease
MGLAISTGVAPQYGLYTAIVAGCVAALFGGSRFQVTGPTAAFIVVLAPIASRHGLGGLLVATLIAGALLVTMGVARLGQAVQYIPAPVTTGFTAGIAVVIATGQVNHFLGLGIEAPPAHWPELTAELATHAGGVHVADAAVGVFTLAVLILFPRLTRKVPAPLVALSAAGLVAYLLAVFLPEFHVATINDKFAYDADGISAPGIPPLPPLFVLPWDVAGSGGQPIDWSFDTVKALTMAGFSIAMLGAIESLLSAVIADGMTGTRHDPDAELVGQGIGNLVAPFFGGFAATGALARTAANIRAGARSPVAAITHSVLVLVSVVALASLLGYLPMAALAAMLLVVAWNMSEVRHVTHTLRVAPRSDVLVMLACFGLTVAIDMTVAVGVGIGLASLLFIRRMSEAGSGRLVAETQHGASPPLPPGVIRYEVAGALFFGAAQRMTRALHAIGEDAKVLVLDVSAVPVIDATGLVQLDSAIERLHRQGTFVIVAGARGDALRVLVRAGWRSRRDHLLVRRDLASALEEARRRATNG